MAPKVTRKNSSTANTAPLSARERKDRTSSSGLGWRSSQATKAAPLSSPTTAKYVGAIPQPECIPSMIAYTADETVSTDSRPPSQSIGPGSTARDGGTSAMAAPIAKSVMGTLMRKLEPHQ